MLGKERQQKDFFDEHVYGRLVPEDHLLVRLAREVDFSFVEEETRDLYSESMGRTSFPPVVLFKVLMLEYFYGLSDPRVVGECQWNLLFRRFLGLGIDEATPDDTTLVVFRKRLGEERFGKLFDRVVGLARERGLVKGELKVVDATHIEADIAVTNTVSLLRQGRRHIIRDVEGRKGKGAEKELREKYWSEERTWGKPSEEEVRAEVALTKAFIEEVKERGAEAVKEKLELLSSLVNEEKEGARVRSFTDTDARGGYRSRKKPFTGYKAHISYDEGSDIVTSCEIMTGEKNEGSHLGEILESDKSKGIIHEAVAADGLYDSADNRALIHEAEMRAYIPSSQKEKLLNAFTYCAQADRVMCQAGKLSVGKSRQERGTLHIFSQSDCKGCSFREICAPQKNMERARVFVSDDHKEKIKDDGPQRTEALAKRKHIEKKFGEAKKWHGMRRARYRGRGRVAIQVLVTFIVMNLKRILAPLSISKTRENLALDSG